MFAVFTFTQTKNTVNCTAQFIMLNLVNNLGNLHFNLESTANSMGPVTVNFYKEMYARGQCFPPGIHTIMCIIPCKFMCPIFLWGCT